MTTATKSEHPAPYSPEVIDAIDAAVRGTPTPVRIHDPFAGDGLRLGALCDEHGYTFTGTELAAPFIIDPRVRHGDSTKATTYPRRRGFIIATSPVYPNGIADHFHATETCRHCTGVGIEPTFDHPPPGIPCTKCGGKGTRDHGRRTYRSAQAKITGRDEPLDQNNMGRWGYRGTSLSSPARGIYWNLARNVVRQWGKASMALVNVKDFYVKERREPVVEPWVKVLTDAGWEIVAVEDVHTRGFRFGSNRENRADAEALIIARREVGS